MQAVRLSAWSLIYLMTIVYQRFKFQLLDAKEVTRSPSWLIREVIDL